MEDKIRLLTVIITTLLKFVNAKIEATVNPDIDNLNEHTMVSDADVFPYVVSILKGNSFVSTGAILDENWVITSADRLFLKTDTARLYRVRLGSINYKKGGILRSVKLIEIHPDFDDKKPNFDLALVLLSSPVTFTQSIRSIRLQSMPREVAATHFIVTSWPDPGPMDPKRDWLKSISLLKRQRILSVTHLHPKDQEECAEELSEIGAVQDGMMCLDPAFKDLCLRDVGAPVVLNGILWGIVSSWKPDDCTEDNATPVFVSLVAYKKTTAWILTTIEDHMVPDPFFLGVLQQ